MGLSTEALPDLSISHTRGFHPGLKQPNMGAAAGKGGTTPAWSQGIQEESERKESQEHRMV